MEQETIKVVHRPVKNGNQADAQYLPELSEKVVAAESHAVFRDTSAGEQVTKKGIRTTIAEADDLDTPEKAQKGETIGPLTGGAGKHSDEDDLSFDDGTVKVEEQFEKGTCGTPKKTVVVSGPDAAEKGEAVDNHIKCSQSDNPRIVPHVSNDAPHWHNRANDCREPVLDEEIT